MFNSFEVSRRRKSDGASPQTALLESRQLLAAVQVVTTPGPNGSVSLDITGSEAEDWIKLSQGPDFQVHLTDDFGTGTTFILNGGSPVSEVTFAAIHNIRLRLGEGNDSARLIDLNAGNIAIEDGFADQELNYYDLTNQYRDSRLGDITANFLRGHNYLNISSSNPGVGVWGANSMNVRKVTVNSKAQTSFSAGAFGQAELVVNGVVTLNGIGNRTQELRTGFSADSENASVRLLGGVKYQSTSGNSTLTLSGDIQVFGNLDFLTGADDDRLYVGGDVTISGQVKMNTGAGTDSFVVSRGTSVFSQNVSLDLGDGLDYVSIEPANAWFRKNLNIDTGKHKDSVFMRNVTVSGDLSVDLGGLQPGSTQGEYFLLAHFEIQKNFSLVSSGLATAYILFNEYWTGIDAPAIFRGTVSMSIGAGAIRVRDVTMQKTQTFRGTNERIQVEYQNVTADLSRRRLINATAAVLP